jgi:hypothetical protein
MPGSRALIAPSRDSENHSSAGRPCGRTDRRPRRVRGTPAPHRARAARGCVCWSDSRGYYWPPPPCRLGSLTLNRGAGPGRRIRRGVVLSYPDASGRGAVPRGVSRLSIEWVLVSRTHRETRTPAVRGLRPPPLQGTGLDPSGDAHTDRATSRPRPRRPHTYPRPPPRVLWAGASRVGG